jgi:hypothetical protein
MSLNINWKSLNNEYVSNFLARAINCIILDNKHLLIGGFAYVDEFKLGQEVCLFFFLYFSIIPLIDSFILSFIHSFTSPRINSPETNI